MLCQPAPSPFQSAKLLGRLRGVTVCHCSSKHGNPDTWLPASFLMDGQV